MLSTRCAKQSSNQAIKQSSNQAISCWMLSTRCGRALRHAIKPSRHHAITQSTGWSIQRQSTRHSIRSSIDCGG
eukprot:3242915-Prymnesium_polylepis.1